VRDKKCIDILVGEAEMESTWGEQGVDVKTI
jgi:hypothetical protein